jgi:hypothetical protein
MPDTPKDVSPKLELALSNLNAEFGALGVALAAARGTDPAVLVHRLVADEGASHEALISAVSSGTREAAYREQGVKPPPEREWPIPDPAPVLGEDIHYLSYGTPLDEYPQACRAAKVTEQDDDVRWVSLVVFNPTGLFFNDTVSFDPDVELGGSWHRPEHCGG